VELRRIEGILLEQAILSKQVEEAYKTAKSLEIKITSRVPEVIQNLLNLPRIKAQVIENKGNRLLLLMENGLELKVENNLNIKVKEGEVLTLTPVKSSPLTFKVIQTEIRKNVSLKLLNGLINSLREFPFEAINTFQKLKNSGLFYENKVLKALIQNSFKELKEDLKYQSIIKGDKEMVNLINLLQLYILENNNRKFFFPIKIEDYRGYLLFKLKDTYKIFIRLEFTESYLNILINAPKDLSSIYIEMESNNEKILEKLKESKEDLGKLLKKPIKTLKFSFKEEGYKSLFKEIVGEDGLEVRV